MINEIKAIIKNYIEDLKMCKVLTGMVMTEGIKISDRLIIPNDFIIGNLKSYISVGDTVRLIRNYGGQEFYIVEIIDKEYIIKSSTLTLSKDGFSYQYKVEDVSKWYLLLILART